MPRTLGAHLAEAHHATSTGPAAEAEHLHRVLHGSALVGLDHHHEGAL